MMSQRRRRDLESEVLSQTRLDLSVVPTRPGVDLGVVESARTNQNQYLTVSWPGSRCVGPADQPIDAAMSGEDDRVHRGRNACLCLHLAWSLSSPATSALSDRSGAMSGLTATEGFHFLRLHSRFRPAAPGEPTARGDEAWWSARERVWGLRRQARSRRLLSQSRRTANGAALESAQTTRRVLGESTIPPRCRPVRSGPDPVMGDRSRRSRASLPNMMSAASSATVITGASRLAFGVVGSSLAVVHRNGRLIEQLQGMCGRLRSSHADRGRSALRVRAASGDCRSGRAPLREDRPESA